MFYIMSEKEVYGSIKCSRPQNFLCRQNFPKTKTHQLNKMSNSQSPRKREGCCHDVLAASFYSSSLGKRISKSSKKGRGDVGSSPKEVDPMTVLVNASLSVDKTFLLVGISEKNRTSLIFFL